LEDKDKNNDLSIFLMTLALSIPIKLVREMTSMDYFILPHHVNMMEVELITMWTT
jgi:hypothetical protein